MGRPLAIANPDDAAPYLAAIRNGCPLMIAAELAGLDYSTIQACRKRFSWFSAAEKKARAECVGKRLKRIERAGMKGNWTADAWWLERQYPDEFGKVDRVEITLRREAERIAKQTGLDADATLAEAERIIASRA